MVYCVFIKWHGKGLEIGIFFFFFFQTKMSLVGMLGPIEYIRPEAQSKDMK